MSAFSRTKTMRKKMMAKTGRFPKEEKGKVKEKVNHPLPRVAKRGEKEKREESKKPRKRKIGT